MRDALSATDSTEGGDAECSRPLPREFGAYELVDEIGRGGMGVVYRARQKAVGRMVAVKLMLGGPFSSEAALSRFRTEAAAAAGLHHPGIVDVYDYGEYDGQPFLVMELIEGRTLAAACGSQPLDDRRAARILRKLAQAVDHAHTRRILHRDLKPSNVLIDAADEPRITDFGLARRMDGASAVTMPGMMLGSPSYVSPEQAAGGVEPTGPAIDIYGLGALLFHLITGRPPFIAATSAETLRLVVESEPPAPTLLNPGVSRDLETICLKCVAKDPACRYPTAAALADDLQRFVEDRPIVARRPSIGYRAVKYTRRHWIGVAAVAGVILALGLGAAMAVHGLLRAERERLAAEEAMNRMKAAQEQFQMDVLHDVDRVADASILIPKAATVVRYYESLPPRSRSRAVERQHAEALDLLASVLWSSPQRDVSRALNAAREQLVLRQKIAREDPNDADAAAELIRAEGVVAVMANNHQYPFSLEHNAAMVRRFEALSARFPENAKVKRCLATSLSVYASAAVQQNRPDEALAAARRARALREEVIAVGYSDRKLLAIETDCLRAEAEAHVRKRDALAAAEAYTLLYERLSEKLRSDPADDTVRYEAARAALRGSHQIQRVDSYEVASEVQLVARDYFRILVNRHPERLDYRMYYALVHQLEAVHLAYADGRHDQARAAWLYFDGLCESAKGHPSYGTCRVDVAHTLACIAARAGNTGEALRWLNEGQKRFDAWWPEMPSDPEARLRNRLCFVDWRWQVLWQAGAAEEALEEANQLLALTEDGLERNSGLPELAIRRVEAHVQAGIALVELGRSSEAVLRMRDALDRLAGMPFVFPVFSADGVSRAGTLALCHALADTGEWDEARRRAWAMMGDVRFTAGSQWGDNELRARTWVVLARVLDPAEASLRLACCERASTLLANPDARGRITREGRKALETAQRLASEARAAMGTLALEEYANRLDRWGTGDSALVNDLLAADERTWGPDSAQSACFSQAARDAQVELRRRCADLVVRRPDSVGARFLLARTHRMEAYVAIALGAKADLARAALLDYDARLETFASISGYEGVWRIRAINRMHLAELAASTGDAASAASEIAEAQALAERWAERAAITEPQRHAWRLRLLQHEAWCAWWLRDWKQLETCARAVVGEAEAGLAEGAESSDLRVGLAVGKAFQTLALHAGGLIPASESALLRCRRELVEAAKPDAIAGVRLLVSAVEDATIESLRMAGDSRRARASAERTLRAAAELRPFPAERWDVDLRLARAQVQLARLLDPHQPYEELRRSELLDQAWALLSVHDAACRLTNDGKETLALIPRLRGPIAPEDRVYGLGDTVVQVTP